MKMKTKRFYIIAICLFVVLSIGGAWYYYYNYVATVNNFFLIKVTPPQQEKVFLADIHTPNLNLNLRRCLPIRMTV